MIPVSVIVPAYNAERTLAECIEALLAQDYPNLEIIIVDDGSTDRTAQIAQGYEGITYLHQSNAGPAAARNRGAATAKGEWLAFTDSDCIAEPDWISALMAKVRANKGRGVVGVGGTYGIANPESLLARIIHAEIQARHARMKDEVDFLGSFNVAYERKAFEAVAGFDESFSQASGEDNELAYRLIDAGGKLHFTRRAIVNHYHPTRLLPYFKTQMRHGYWRVRLNKKHENRSRGDAYADGTELRLTIGLAGSLLGGILGITIMLAIFNDSDYTFIASYSLGIAISYLLIRIPMSIRLTKLGYIVQGFLYPWFALARDFPRAVGLIWGSVHFYLLRRTTA
ncbi:MAG: hypothetical protein RLZZ303_2256 [Candidatus Hydrogenedentota bacterium]|jgi:glycosyltransferase involved in cell wall biosynthesis